MRLNAQTDLVAPQESESLQKGKKYFKSNGERMAAIVIYANTNIILDDGQYILQPL